MAISIQDYAKSKKIRLHQAKSIIKAVLGEVPETLTDDEIQRIDQAGTDINSAEQLSPSEQAQLPPAQESTAITEVQEDSINSQRQSFNAQNLPVSSLGQLLDVDLVLEENQVQQRLDDHYTNVMNRISNHNQRMESTLLSSIAANYEQIKNHKPVQLAKVDRTAIDEIRVKLKEIGIDLKS
jgi:hypothetical protein